jgi:L-ascorbate metabolism protein UlaG (beta-lactamase superfamily)
LDYILVGHAHVDHALDAGTAALTWGAQVIGSSTTCFIAEAQGLPASRCTVVEGGSRLTLGAAELRVVRSVHWDPAGVGAYSALDAPPAVPFDLATTFGANGGTYGYVFVHPDTPSPLVWYWQGSLAPLTSDDGSGTDFQAELDNAFADLPNVETWIGAVDSSFTTDASTLAPFLDTLRPRAVVPQHWDSMFSVPRTGLTSEFPDSPALMELLDARGVPLLVEHQYFEQRVISADGTDVREDTAVRRAFGL